ncbi:MAG: mechanosensitive ion channel family protein [Ramlibacter sp.]
MNFSDATDALQGLATGFVHRLPHMLVGLLVFGFFYAVARLVRVAVRRVLGRREALQNAGEVVGRLGFGLILLLGLLVALVIAVPGFTPGQLVNVLGLSSVAIGFAFRDILQNFLAGILLLIAQPFRVGDQIVTGQYEGTVEEIQTRATFLRTYDGRRVVIPNANLFTSPVTVNTAYPARRLEYEVGIGYGDDIAHAKRVMLQVLRGLPEAIDEPAPEALVVRLGESSVDIRLRWWVQPPRQFDTLHALDTVLHAVRDALREAGIDTPFPTRQILFHDQTEEYDGDRSRQREGWPAAGPPPPQARIFDALRDSARRARQQEGGRGPD